MPFKGKRLAEEVIARIADWINAGAPYDRPLQAQASSKQARSEPRESEHWAFQLPRRPAIPAVKNRAWVRNPIDAFVAAEHENKGLRPLPPVERSLLLRRVYLDLIGLPPTPEETRAFLLDGSKDAYEKVVDRLLASRHYGERWGRHWMDVWRYSDWYGLGNEVRNSQRHIWRWRDWIIESLNQDKGYDRIVIEMLAGDEVAPNDPKVLAATGYLVRNWYRYNRNLWLQNIVEHTASGFLGITLKCARCHDHKYDPIGQEDYYRFRAFFEPHDVRTDRVPGQPDLLKDGLPRVFDAEASTHTFRFVRGNEKNPDTEHPLSPGLPEILGGSELQIKPVSFDLEAYYPDFRSFVHRDLIAQANIQIEKAEAALMRDNLALVQATRRVAELPAHSANNVINSPKPAAESMSAVNFQKEIKPILEKSCFVCHSSQNDRSGLVLESPESILRGGINNGPAIITRKSGESSLILYLRGERTPRMPLEGDPLPEGQIALIAKWIDQLPEEEPHVQRTKAEAVVALAEKELATARANLPAIEARIAADKATYGTPKDRNLETLALVAKKAERVANFRKAEESFLRAEQQFTEARSLPDPLDKYAERKLAEARKQLKAAQDALESRPDYTSAGKIYPDTSTGRRLALARWIASQQNPLTARVAMNHIWLRHFGKALVPTVANFGLNGARPTHPELLDWLAVEFMEKNWSMKAMHQLIVTSQTYRMQSSTRQPDQHNLAVDPENRYLWRRNVRRMEAEVVRDSMLHLAGQLDTTMSGPELDEKQAETSHRRSLYFRHSPDAEVGLLKLFDAADPDECYERIETIVPQQALALANSKLSITQARLLARRVSERVGSQPSATAAFAAGAFEQVIGRSPSTEELAECIEFLREQAELFRDPKNLTAFRAGSPGEVNPPAHPHLRARENLAQALFMHNEFVTIR